MVSMGICVAKKCAVTSPEEAAQTQIYCAVAPELRNVTGQYFAECKIAKEGKYAKNRESAESLWKASEKWVEMQ